MAATLPVGAAAQTYRVDPARSQATIHVGKAGAFSFIAGHTHEVSGPIAGGSVDVDAEHPSRSTVRLVIAASELKVSAAKEPEGDAPKVQDAMVGANVLDVARHPQITYESTAVTVRNRSGTVWELTVAGRLTIRDVTQLVTAPVRVEFTGSGLTATGEFTIRQTAFGIKPVSVGGVVAVKDALGLVFSISADRQP
jgi:polyisoprenoid-binding protein YceI